MGAISKLAWSRHKYRFTLAFLARSATIIGIIATVGAAIGSIWFISYLISRPGGVGDISDDLNLSLAVPVAAFGVATLAGVALYFSASGLIYQAINAATDRKTNLAAVLQSEPSLEEIDRPSFLVEQILFCGLSLISIAYIISGTIQVVTKGTQRAPDQVWLVLILAVTCVSSVVAFRDRASGASLAEDKEKGDAAIAKRITMLTEEILQDLKYARWRVFVRRIIAIITASIFWIAPTGIICLFFSRPIEVEFANQLPIYVEATTLAALVVLAGVSNYRIATSGADWTFLVAVLLTVILCFLAPGFFSSIPFQLLDQADRNGRFVLQQKQVNLLRAIHSSCKSVMITKNNETTFHIFSSIGSDYTARCDKQHFVRIAKSSLGPEVGTLARQFREK